MARLFATSALLAALWAGTAAAQTTQDEIFTFRSLNQDARVSRSSWLDGSIYNFGYTGGSYTYLAATAGLVPSPRFEVALALTYLSSSFTGSRSGLTDPMVHAKYNFAAGTTRLSAGGFLSLPVGSEDIGEGDLDAGVFLALRQPVGERTTVGARISGDYFELTKDDRDPSVRLAGHVIQRLSGKVALLGEALVNTNVATVIEASGGVDVAVGPRSRLRAVAGLGLNDNASDRLLGISFVHQLR